MTNFHDVIRRKSILVRHFGRDTFLVLKGHFFPYIIFDGEAYM